MEIWIFDQINAALRLISYETFHKCYCQFHRIFKKIVKIKTIMKHKIIPKRANM